MPRLLILCLHRRRRVAPPGRRLVHLELGRSQQPASAVDVAVGLVVIFMTFLTPCGYVLSNLHRFRRE
uniref:Cytochrome c oxidase subunit 8 n=1 Tax=Molossus molossus TaxID=27622 RepID=A0A7J8JS31_MOLMO|nr:cytochrome c oxidase subunit 8C [Molossus molossus]